MDTPLEYLAARMVADAIVSEIKTELMRADGWAGCVGNPPPHIRTGPVGNKIVFAMTQARKHAMRCVDAGAERVLERAKNDAIRNAELMEPK